MARKSKYTESAEDLNLVPIMNLVLCLIPLVLFKTQLVKIGMINVSAPSFGPASSSKPKEDNDEKPLGLTVALGKDGFILSATGANLFELLNVPQEGEVSGVKIPKKQDTFSDKDGADVKRSDYDYLQLYSYLEKLRDMYKDEKLLTLVADPDLEFKYLIRTMDVVRFRFAEPSSFKSIADMSAASDKYKYKKIEVESTNEKGETVKSTAYEGLWDQVTFGNAQ
jgi:hypothetical protein